MLTATTSGAPMGPGSVGARSTQIRSIANQTRQAAQNRMINFNQIQAIPGGTQPVGAPPAAAPPTAMPPAAAPPATMQRAAALLVDNRDILDRFVDRILRKV